jgi:hypothetical protein
LFTCGDHLSRPQDRNVGAELQLGALRDLRLASASQASASISRAILSIGLEVLAAFWQHSSALARQCSSEPDMARSYLSGMSQMQQKSDKGRYGPRCSQNIVFVVTWDQLFTRRTRLRGRKDGRHAVRPDTLIPSPQLSTKPGQVHENVLGSRALSAPHPELKFCGGWGFAKEWAPPVWESGSALLRGGAVQACADLNADQANGAIPNDRSIWVEKMGVRRVACPKASHYKPPLRGGSRSWRASSAASAAK